MTKEEIKAIETHIEIHAKAESRAIKITEILRKAVRELRDNKLLGERCNQLLKDKGDLTDRCRELEREKCELLGLIQAKDELIEKMKCCENCRHPITCNICNNYDKWEIKENE